MRGLAARDTAADPAAVVARASAIRRRRYALTGGAAVSLATVVGVMAAFGTSSSSGAGVITPIAESPATTPDATFEPTAEPTPTPTATAVPTVEPTAEPTAEPSEKRPEPTEQPSTFPPPRYPKPVGPGLVVTIDPPDAPVTGENAVFRVRVTDTDGRWTSGGARFGDGSSSPWFRTHTDCAPPPSPAPPPDYVPYPTDETRTYEHTYRKAGTYTFTVEVETDAHVCGNGESQPERKTATATVTVTGQDLPANGPAQPTADFFAYDDGNGSLRLEVFGNDADGRMTKYQVEWGDNSWNTNATVESACGPTTPEGYPKDGSFRADVEHQYEDLGTYEVTLRVTSAACDGGDEQTGTLTRTVTMK
jgi:hypothetical protein